MSGVTDKLIGLARELSETPCERELDVLMATGEQQSIALLCMALHELGEKAVSFTGGAGRDHHLRQPHAGAHPQH